MNIGFPYAFKNGVNPQEAKLGEVFVKLVKERFPQYQVIQMSDMTTPEVPGIDGCIRTKTEENLGLWYYKAILNFTKGPFLRLDYDTIILQDVSDVFEKDFDIAIAKEKLSTLNNGVMFIKDRDIFSHALGFYIANTTMDGWMDLQKSTQMAIDTGRYKVERLERDIYNKTDSKTMEDDNAKILHFKGWRKKLMLEKYDSRA